MFARRGLVAGLALGLSVAGCSSTPGASSARTTALSASTSTATAGPTTTAVAIAGGEVHPAVLTSGVAVLSTPSGVWAVRAGRLISVPAGDLADPVEISNDHRHLAWIERSSVPPARAVLFDLETQQRQLIDFPVPSVLAWSPDGRWLAEYSQVAGGLWVVASDGTNLHQLVRGGDQVDSMVWTPDSATIAFSGTGNLTIGTSQTAGYDGVWTLPVAGGDRTTIVAPQPSRASAYLLAGWTGATLLAWIDPQHSASLAADGLDLVPIGQAAQHALVTTLPAAGFIVPLTADRVLTVEGSDRELRTSKRLLRCSLSSTTCTAIAAAGGMVEIEPSLSTDGQTVAFVLAADTAGANVTDWASTRTLAVVPAAGGSLTSIAAAGAGVFDPRWTADGKIVFERHQATTVELWLDAPKGSGSSQLIARFAARNEVPSDRAGTSAVAFVP